MPVNRKQQIYNPKTKRWIQNTAANRRRIEGYKTTSASAKRSYRIHDNGGRPFLVAIDSPTVVSVYKLRDPDEPHPTNRDYSVLVRRFRNVQKIFVGKSPLNEMTKFSGGHGPKFDGNSILLKMPGGEYVFIGWEIFSFKPGDEITHYYSPVGNNDVPYPVALGKKYVFFLIEKSYALRSEFKGKSNWADAYKHIYKYDGVQQVKERRMRVRKIQERLW